MKLSIHIVTCDRHELFVRCATSIAQELPLDCEVCVVVNGGNRNTLSWLERVSPKGFFWITVPREKLSQSRNRAFQLCQGEIVHCLDDDVTVPGGFFQRVLDCFLKFPDLVLLGGPNLTPPKSPFKEKLFGAVMTSPFAAPMVRRRYSDSIHRKATIHDFIFCNLAFRKDSIGSAIRFREGLRSNEESLFLYEAHRLGLNYRFSNDLYLFHRRRPNLSLFLKQIFSYGKGRANQTLILFQSAHPFFFVPAGFVLSLIAGLFLPIKVVMTFGVTYFLFSLAGSLASKEIRMLKFHGILMCTILTFLIHFVYGLGFLKEALIGSLRVFWEGFRKSSIQPEGASNGGSPG